MLTYANLTKLEIFVRMLGELELDIGESSSMDALGSQTGTHD